MQFLFHYDKIKIFLGILIISSYFSVMIGRHRNAFCVVRPPGHHAGVKGLLAGAESCGFCIFNNVAAGALHAISEERLQCQRCAIVDIDVHHGNGTEEIVKRCHNPAKLFFFSIHLHDNDKRKNSYNFYPGTGDEDDLTHNVINVPIAPLWKESAQSTNTTASTINSHNTRQRSKRKAEEVVDINGEVTKDDTSETGVVSNVDAADTESESASMRSSHYVGSSTNTNNRNSKNVPTNMGRLAYRRAIQNRLLPSLRAFNPDLILISAGFDAAKGDVGNARHFGGGKERMGLDLEPEDYAWTTRKILEIADICCQGRVVSVLEGGYGRSPVIPPAPTDSTSKTETNNSLDKAFFSECAIRHLHALIDPYDQEARFGPDRSTPLT
jgi:acetoin utilization deacetylase AcuC-like enzyme